MSRGRSRPIGMQAGDVIDFWRVELVETGRAVLLRAEMRMPGKAWLQFDLMPQDDGSTRLRCCAWFQPRGLAGEIYWYALYPIHLTIFSGMVQKIRQLSERSRCAAMRAKNPVFHVHAAYTESPKTAVPAFPAIVSFQ